MRPWISWSPGVKYPMSMNFLNLTSYDVKICSVDSYNQHSFGNGPQYTKFEPWEYFRPSKSNTKKNAKLPFFAETARKKKNCLGEEVAENRYGLTIK